MKDIAKNISIPGCNIPSKLLNIGFKVQIHMGWKRKGLASLMPLGASKLSNTGQWSEWVRARWLTEA